MSAVIASPSARAFSILSITASIFDQFALPAALRW
jgi:hypothetical protein